MKNRIFKIVALILALLLAVSAFAGCDGEETKKKKKKKVQKVVITNKNEDKDEDDDDTEDTESDVSYDEYVNDDIELSLDYDSTDSYNIRDLLENQSTVYQINAYNNSNPLSKTFIGPISSVYHATHFVDKNAHGQYYTDEMLDLELSRYANAGFEYFRTPVWSDWVWTGDPENPWDWNSETMQGFYNYCNKVKEYGLEVIIVLYWSYPNVLYGGSQYLSEVDYLYPRLLDENGNTIVVERWGQYFEEPDMDLVNKRAAEYAVGLFKSLKERGITNANHLLLGNEPHEDGGTAAGAFWEYQISTFRAIHEGLEAAGLRDSITTYGPNQSAPSGRAGLARKFVENAPEVFDVYTSHMTVTGQTSVDDMYSNNHDIYTGYMQVMDDFGLRYEQPFWLDEFGTNGDHFGEADNIDDPWFAVHDATTMIAAFNAGISGISIWQFYDQLWPDYYGSGGEYLHGYQVSGCHPALYNSETPWSNYYTITLFSKYLKSADGKLGTSYLGEAEDDSSSLYCTAVNLGDGGWSIVISNQSTDPKSFDINFEKSLGGVTLYRYLYSPATVKPTSAGKIITADKGFKNIESKLSDSIPAGGVVIYSTIKNIAQ